MFNISNFLQTLPAAQLANTLANPQAATPTPAAANPRQNWQATAGLFTGVSSNTVRGANYFNFGKVSLGGTLGLGYRLIGQSLQANLNLRGSYPYDSTTPFPPNSWSAAAGFNGQVPLGRSDFSLLWGARFLISQFNPRTTFKPPSGPSINSEATVTDVGIEASLGLNWRIYNRGIYAQNPLTLQASGNFALMSSLLNSTASMDRNGSLRGLLLEGDRFPTDVNTHGLAWRAAVQVAVPCALPLGPVCLGANGEFQFERGDYAVPHHWSTSRPGHEVSVSVTRVNTSGGITAQVRW